MSIRRRPAFRSSSSPRQRSAPRTVRGSMARSRRSWGRTASMEFASSAKFGAPWATDSKRCDMAKILVVEDNVTNMKLSTFLLESADHEVIAAANAEAGLTLARDSHPDLILM